MNTGWIVALVVAVISGVVWILVLMWLRRPRRGPAFEGDPVRGTAQVLSATGVNGMTREDYDWEQIRFAYCEIALRVQLPDHEPYDATIFQHVKVVDMANLPGATVVVVADSANPQDVRIATTSN